MKKLILILMIFLMAGVVSANCHGNFCGINMKNIAPFLLINGSVQGLNETTPAKIYCNGVHLTDIFLGPAEDFNKLITLQNPHVPDCNEGDFLELKFTYDEQNFTVTSKAGFDMKPPMPGLKGDFGTNPVSEFTPVTALLAMLVAGLGIAFIRK